MAERGWFGRRKKKAQQGEKVVVDGSEIRELVEDEEAFGMLVETKFQQLDADGNGRLNVRDLRPAVADIEAALGVPVEEASTNTDHVYSEAQVFICSKINGWASILFLCWPDKMLTSHRLHNLTGAQVVSELTHGTDQGEVSKAEFQEALHDILLGVAAGLKRDPIVILRMDGEDLKDFVDSSRYEPEAAAIFSRLGGGQDPALRQSLLAALQHLTVDHGMPPASDEWVAGNIIAPALLQLPADQLDQPASREGFLEQLKKLLGAVAERLQEQPVIIAHTENTFDGSGVKRLLANKFELDRLLDSVWKNIPAEHKNKASKECLRDALALDKMADAARLPPYGAVAKVDVVVDEAIKTANAGDGKAVDGVGFKRLLTNILGAVMLRLNESPVFVSTNTVVHEPLSSPSTMSAPPSVTPMPSE